MVKPYLTKFLEYCADDDAFAREKEAGKTKRNFAIIMNELQEKKQDSVVNQRYSQNISLCRKMTENMGIVHNTNLAGVIGILANRALLSIIELEKRDISFNYRVSATGINEEMHSYVFAYPHKSDWIYGLYEIRFTSQVESIPNAYFLPKIQLQHESFQPCDCLLALSDWRTYLAEFIAVSLDNPEEYFKLFPVYMRPEFLFEDRIDIKYIEGMTCKGKTAFEELVERITSEFGPQSEFLKMITYTE
ncbi:hypothetical protein [Phosphitispora fastidiosa]|uniref:hypothetical protein n=1 Tax=Phosphitispora fastidiosa TaxID=2837202 RepID=UPI001E432C34|nr:hypothetical protein [Phosphitispora fastidiosa]MBU7007151.1 hypothetical protein [Phosphitispora fastidiosa]